MLKNILILAKNNHDMILVFNDVMCIFFLKILKGIQQNISNG